MYGALNVVMSYADKFSTFGAVSRGRHVTHARVVTVVDVIVGGHVEDVAESVWCESWIGSFHVFSGDGGVDQLWL